MDDIFVSRTVEFHVCDKTRHILLFHISGNLRSFSIAEKTVRNTHVAVIENRSNGPFTLSVHFEYTGWALFLYVRTTFEITKQYIAMTRSVEIT